MEAACMQEAGVDDQLNGEINGGDEAMGGSNGGSSNGEGDVGMESPEGGSSDENEVEGALVNSIVDHSPFSLTVPIPSQNGLVGTAVSGPTSTSSPSATMATNSPNSLDP